MRWMPPIKFLVVVCILTLCVTSCDKSEDNEFQVKKEELKNDTLVSKVSIESYVNKVYIDLVGRKPIDSELSTAIGLLYKNKASKASREQFVESIIESKEYFNKLYNYNKSEYLNGVEESEILAKRQEITYVITLAINDGNKILEDELRKQLMLIDSLDVVPERLRSKAFSESEMHKRMCLNPFYDEINMGVPNFTFSVFESFLFRAPTIKEWESAQNICNNFGGALFGINGISKREFLDIIFQSDHYFEGRVISAYLRFYGRIPASVELFVDTQELIKKKEFNELYKKIVVSNEYFGR